MTKNPLFEDWPNNACRRTTRWTRDAPWDGDNRLHEKQPLRSDRLGTWTREEARIGKLAKESKKRKSLVRRVIDHLR